MSAKASNIILSVILLVLAVAYYCFTYFIFIDEAGDEILEQEKVRLYELEKNTDKNLESLMSLENVAVDNYSGNIRVVFYGQDCKLEVIYDNDFDIVEKTFEDTRASRNVVFIVFVLLFGMILIVSLGCLLSMIVEIAIGWCLRKIRQRRAKRRATSNDIKNEA